MKGIGEARVREAAMGLLEYCRSRDWAGPDPYDALTSRIYRALPVLDHRVIRLVFTQLNKRSPVNLRPLLGIPPRQNAKGLALFVTALIKLARAGVSEERDTARELAARLLELKSPGEKHACWGYSFPWQTRSRLVPEGEPNLVCTTFVANALLDAHREFGDGEFLEAARSAANYLVEDLYYQSEDGTVAGFAYPLPTMRNEIHNANFLGAALLGRVSAVPGSRDLLGAALAAARYSAGRQRADGSWLYGETPNYRWIDSFHTGFNLVALRELGRHAGTDEFEDAVERGFAFYRAHFFREDGAPRYFHDATYPIDAHTAAQGILTLLAHRNLGPEVDALLPRVLGWTIGNLRGRKGCFHYQKKRWFTNRIPYMRWSQAWMLLALACCLEEAAASDATTGGPVEDPAP